MDSPVQPSVVWMVEDNSPFRQAMAGLINQQSDLTCPIAVGTCEEALALITDPGDDFVPPDIVLLDIGLPGMSGIEGTRYFHDHLPLARVIMLTVHEYRDTVFEALQAGASGYLLKSSRAEQLIESLREVVAGGAPLNSSIARKILERFHTAADRQADYGLTPRESEMLQHMVEGLSTRELAEELGVSAHTVDTHTRNIYAKLHVRSRGKAVAKALKERLIRP
jgi:DNA-binding NarL/FixJ family response regulator